VRFRQAALLPLTQRFFCRALSLHRHHPASSLLRASPPPSGRSRLFIPIPRWLRAAQEGFPGAKARSSSTDLSPRAASNHPIRFRVHPTRRTGRSRLANEAESSSLALRLMGSSARGFSVSGFPPAAHRLHVQCAPRVSKRSFNEAVAHPWRRKAIRIAQVLDSSRDHSGAAPDTARAKY
jgi:hypothetical protein